MNYPNKVLLLSFSDLRASRLVPAQLLQLRWKPEAKIAGKILSNFSNVKDGRTIIGCL